MFLIFFFCTTLLFAEGATQEPHNFILKTKDLKRTVDAVVVEGKLLPEVLGKPLSNLRLYSYKNKTFEPIRYQIDEMTEDGDWIFPEGPVPNGNLTNGKLDAWDKLTFMVEDMGDKIIKQAWPSGYTSGSEIEIADPFTGEKGWCYFLYFESNPPPKSSFPPHIRYDYETEIFETDVYGCQYLITKDGLHTTFVTEAWQKKEAEESNNI